MLLIIDNYDSFTYNLMQYFAHLGQKIIVKRNDQLTIADIEKLKPSYIVISPGPCTPKQAGISTQVVVRFKEQIPILGICLGHQVIAKVFGAKVVLAHKEMHGKQSTISHNNKGIFAGIKNSFIATRYHSLIVEQKSIPKTLEITAWIQNDSKEYSEIMGIRHHKLPIEGVQFHPESIASEQGMELLANFLSNTSTI